MWVVKLKCAAYLITVLLGTVGLPTIAFIWCMIEKRDDSIVFHWNVVCFANCMMLACIQVGSTIKPLFDTIFEREEDP
jgi:hypothetical protein